jgi:hypothetical protein
MKLPQTSLTKLNHTKRMPSDTIALARQEWVFAKKTFGHRANRGKLLVFR